MNKKMFLLVLIILFGSVNTFMCLKLTGDEKKFPLIAMTNHVEFYNTSSSNPLVGCSFLLATEKGIFSVTCKHTLWIAKSKEMKGVHFEGTLKEWRMRRKDDTTKYVITDKLINQNRDELIGEDVVHSDYLVFSIKQNLSDVVPVKLSKRELKEGEPLYLVGWSFKDKTGVQRVYKAKYYKSITNHLLIELEDGSNLAGMSGGPVLDADGMLVGIISEYTQDEITKKWYNSPCSTEYLKKVLNML